MTILKIKNSLISLGHTAVELLPPPQDCKRTWSLIEREKTFAELHPYLTPLRGLATTVAVATLSLFNGFYYIGREALRTAHALRNKIKKCSIRRPPFDLRSILSSFILAAAALIYLIYSLATLGIGPLFTNKLVCDKLKDLEIDRETHQLFGNFWKIPLKNVTRDAVKDPCYDGL